MEKKYYYLLGIVAIMGIILISSCVQQSKLEPAMAMSPYIEFEATVVSVSLDESGNYLEGNKIVSAPRDSAVVRIDNIVERGDSYNFDSSIRIEEGKEVKLNFKYAARPTKIITIVGEATQEGDTVSHQIAPTKIAFEDGYFVFRENGNSETETILPGLQAGSKFRTKLWRTFQVKVEKYELIS